MKRLVRPNPIRPSSSSSNGRPTIDSVLSTVRSVWKTVEEVSGSDQASLKAEIANGINLLKIRIDRRLRKLVGATPIEQDLFAESDVPAPVLRFPESYLRYYAKDLGDQALQHLPQTATLHSIEELRRYLSGNLRFNSEATRRRYGNYLISRYFPGERFNDDLPAFAAAAANTPALGEALFYLTCRTEKIVALVAEEVVFSSVAQGGINRTRIRDFVQSKFPNSISANEIAAAIAKTYQKFGVGTATRIRLSVALREGSLASFAYVLHMEFPEPGMHAFEKMFDGPMHKWLLWDQQWMIRQLYRLREAGLLSKVSEIDRMRQFTTKYTLAESVQRIVALAQESPQ